MTTTIRKTRNLLLALSVTAFSLYAGSTVMAGGPCTPVLYSPVLTGSGASCSAATANLNSQLTNYVNMACDPEGECGNHNYVYTTGCQSTGGGVEISGYARYSCYAGWGEFASRPEATPEAITSVRVGTSHLD